MNFTNNTKGLIQEISEFKIEISVVDQILENILAFLGLAGFEVSVKFVSLEEMRKLNSSFRQIDNPTDVLSFPFLEWKTPITINAPHDLSLERNPSCPPQILGDIAISMDKAKENADKIGQSVDRELCFLMTHGVLHLCGHDHMTKEDEAIMFNEQDEIMYRLSKQTNVISGKSPIWQKCVELKERPQ